MDREYEYMVSTHCMTYNQVSYIGDTLEGFVMQKVSFPVVYIIVDDASTDGESKYLENWAKNHLRSENKWTELTYGRRIVSSLNNNSLVTFVILLLYENHFKTGRFNLKSRYIKEWDNAAKYLALCEGDDYWVDPLKLQKQVSFLEGHPEYALCHHNMYYRRGDDLRVREISIPQSQSLTDLARSNVIQTATVLYRIPSYSIIPDEFENRRVYAHFIFMRVCEQGDVYYINEPMSVYRLHDGGIFSKQSKFQQFSMTIDNINAIADWYREINDDVLAGLNQRAKDVFIDYLIASLKRLKILDAIRITYYFFHNQVM